MPGSPFTDTDWRALEALIESNSPLRTDEAYGWLPAIAIHPDPDLLPSRWFPALFADATWQSEADVGRAFDLASRAYNHIGALIRANDFAMPTIDLGPELVAFCRAFVEGLDMSTMWRRNHFAVELVEPFRDIGALEIDMLLKPTRPEQIDFVLDRCADFDDDDLAACLYELADEFDAMRLEILRTNPRYAARRPIRREGAKVSRNDPCPCGSGKKFKKCCGN